MSKQDLKDTAAIVGMIVFGIVMWVTVWGLAIGGVIWAAAKVVEALGVSL